MDVPPLMLLLGLLHLTWTGVLSRHTDHRNLFTQRACCKRQSHVVYIGQDISGGPVSIDVGMCRPHCGGGSRSSHDAAQQEYSKYSSMLEFLKSKRIKARGSDAPEAAAPTQLPSCGMNQACEPTGMRVERVLLLEGPREVEVIEECHCEIRLSQCFRVPALRTYYSDTPYEAVIDVGGCSRSKGSPEGFSCVPTVFDSALVETPNKVDLVQTVVACELKESCYRVSHVEYYYEAVYHAEGVKEERLKVSPPRLGFLRRAWTRTFFDDATFASFVIAWGGNGAGVGRQTVMKCLYSPAVRRGQHLIKLIRCWAAGTARPRCEGPRRVCSMLIHARPTAADAISFICK
ncbi:uncharacterized protein pnhd isoform X1 [Betta splendens]|uniref:Uncharacterized protein pnhd isoform X1 n=1 Tax=Betta splendens TaxID=158456 RepID=A0A9W2XCI2_BETSP|nr:uncharacterized protein pnhd isoform X1 [Betta splendens]